MWNESFSFFSKMKVFSFARRYELERSLCDSFLVRHSVLRARRRARMKEKILRMAEACVGFFVVFVGAVGFGVFLVGVSLVISFCDPSGRS